MDEKVFKIALIYLSQTDPEPLPKDTEQLNLSDKEIVQNAESAIKLHFDPIIKVTLKRIPSTSDLFTIAKHVVSQYYPSSNSAKEKLDEVIRSRPLNRATLLNTVEDLAYDNKESIKQTALDKFRKEPTNDPDDIRAFIQDFLTDIKMTNIIPNLRKIRQLQ